MRTKIAVLGVITFLFANTAFAGETVSKEESAGVGAGVVIGATIGGPFGAILGAAVGAKIGDTLFRRKSTAESLSADLDSSRTKVSALETDVRALNTDIDALGSDLERMRAIAKPELLSLMKAGIEMDLLFRTDEDVLVDATGARLNVLAASLAAMPDVRIKLDGYADERGDATYNQELSVRRVEYVRGLLVANGVPLERIQINGHGETPSTQNDVDSYALDRKVSLTLFIDESHSFAANPTQ